MTGKNEFEWKDLSANAIEVGNLTRFRKALESLNDYFCQVFLLALIVNFSQLDSSVGRVLDYHAGGHGFKPQPDHHSGSLNN